MGGEDDVPVGAADPFGQERDKARRRRASSRRTRAPPCPPSAAFELLAVALDRERRVVRSEHEADDGVRARVDRPVCRLVDVRSPVLHPGEDRKAQRVGETRARLLGDRIQRVRVLDPEPPVAADEILEVLRARSAARRGCPRSRRARPRVAPATHMPSVRPQRSQGNATRERRAHRLWNNRYPHVTPSPVASTA